jgi:uncharacterized membrane protein (UPF0182 family)
MPTAYPRYFIRDIDHTPSDEAVRRSIPVGRPRLYFGELTNTYVMTDTQVQELDFPSGDDNVYTTYAGNRRHLPGIPWRRLLFAWHLQRLAHAVYRRLHLDAAAVSAPHYRSGAGDRPVSAV